MRRWMTVLVVAMAATVGGCAFLGPSPQEVALMQKVAVLEAQRAAATTPEAAAKAETELAAARTALSEASKQGVVGALLTSDGAVDLLKLAGPPGAIAGYLLMAWRRQRANVRALVAGGEAVLEAVDKGGLTRETAKVAMRQAQEQAGAGQSLYREIATLKAQIRGA